MLKNNSKNKNAVVDYFLDSSSDIGFEKCSQLWSGNYVNGDAYHTIYKSSNDFRIFLKSKEHNKNKLICGLKKNFINNNLQSGFTEGLRKILFSIKDKTEMRTNCAGPVNIESFSKKGWKENIDYKLINKNRYIRLKDGKSGSKTKTAKGNRISSLMVGYKNFRFPPKNGPNIGLKKGLGVWALKNPEEWGKLSDLARSVDLSFSLLAPSLHRIQKDYCNQYIPHEFKIKGTAITTLSINRYSNQSQYDMPNGMSVHIDKGDFVSGLTTIAVFREGNYNGAFFVMPRYGIAIDAEDGDIIFADSTNHHGVSPIYGDGCRVSCVCYCDTSLGRGGNNALPRS